MNKGTLAFDIDGTLADSSHRIPLEIRDYLHGLHEEGWNIALVTGRTLSFAQIAICEITFPYTLALQNGADILEMPARKLISRSYLPKSALALLDELSVSLEEDFIIYSGYERGDICYYRPSHFSGAMLEYLKKLEKLAAKPWKEVESLSEIDQEEFPLVKCIGSERACGCFDEVINKQKDLHACVIQDPIDPTLYLNLITHVNADKGKAVENMPRPLIAAGDDNNDIPLLKVADVAIAINTAPAGLKEVADHIAAPPSELGIIKTLSDVL